MCRKASINIIISSVNDDDNIDRNHDLWYRQCYEVVVSARYSLLNIDDRKYLARNIVFDYHTITNSIPNEHVHLCNDISLEQQYDHHYDNNNDDDKVVDIKVVDIKEILCYDSGSCHVVNLSIS